MSGYHMARYRHLHHHRKFYWTELSALDSGPSWLQYSDTTTKPARWKEGKKAPPFSDAETGTSRKGKSEDCDLRECSCEDDLSSVFTVRREGDRALPGACGNKGALDTLAAWFYGWKLMGHLKILPLLFNTTKGQEITIVSETWVPHFTVQKLTSF